MQAELVAFGHQQLHPQADSHQGFLPTDHPMENLDQTQVMQRFHGVAKRADAGENDPVGGFDPGRVGRNHGRQSHGLAGPLHAAHISHLVIHN